jgi:hypothetical protein
MPVVETTAISERAIHVRLASTPTTFHAPPSHLRVTLPGRNANAKWIPSFERQLRALFDLQPGWDTYFGRRITLESAEAAILFAGDHLEPLTADPWLVPLADGGLQLEWHENGIDLEVAFPATDEPELYALDLETGIETTADPRDVEPTELTNVLTKLRRKL